MKNASWFGQIVTVVRLNVRNMPRRFKLHVIAILGFASVVLVMTGMLSVRQGIEAAFGGGSDTVAVIMRKDAQVEADSSFSIEQVGIIESFPGIARQENTPDISREYLATLRISHGENDVINSFTVRGLEPPGLTLHAPIRVVQGRQFEFGKQELMVGRQALTMNPELAIGNTVQLGKGDWRVVGVFEADGSQVESELWTDAGVLQDSFGDTGTYNVVYARLFSPGDLSTLRLAANEEVRAVTRVLSARDYLLERTDRLRTFISVIGGLIAVLMGFGAVIGAIITMYTAIAARTKEIATMRSLGFGRSTLVLGLVTEAMILGLIGGAIGCAVAYAMFNGLSAHTLQGTQVGFKFVVDASLLLTALAYSVLLGLIGGFIPSFSAGRLNLATALRE